MSYETKFIEVTFSNTEQIRIPADLVGDLIFTDHENVFSRVAVNSFLESDIYNFVYLAINRKLSDKVEVTSFFGEALNEELNASERIYKYKDITHIDVIYNEELGIDTKKATVAWPTELDVDHYVNPLQSVRINDAGDIEILIATKSSEEKHKELLNAMQEDFADVKKMDYKWKMFS